MLNIKILKDTGCCFIPNIYDDGRTDTYYYMNDYKQVFDYFFPPKYEYAFTEDADNANICIFSTHLKDKSLL